MALSRIEQGPRFQSPVQEICPRQAFGADAGGRLGTIDSFHKDRVVQFMLPNALAVYKKTGELGSVQTDGRKQSLVFPTENKTIAFDTTIPSSDGRLSLASFNPEAVSDIDGGLIAPVSGWGSRFDVMHMYWGDDVPPSIVDIPEHLSRIARRQQASILSDRMTEGPVYWGANYYGGTVVAKGGQSVFAPHEHMWQFGSALDGQTPGVIKAIRSEQIWDEGVSQTIGTYTAGILQEHVLPKYWETASTQADPLGLTISLPGFSPQKIAEPEFIDNFWRPLSHIIHENLRHAHRNIFKSELNDVIDYVKAARRNPQAFNIDEYNNFFTPNTEPTDDPTILKLRQLDADGILRHPPGWSGGIQFRPEGAFVAIAFGTINESIGPVECMGVTLKRPKEPESLQASQEKNIIYGHAAEIAIQAA